MRFTKFRKRSLLMKNTKLFRQTPKCSTAYCSTVKIAFTPAVELSYLPENEQKILFDEIEYADATSSLSQAQRLRRFSEQGRLSVDTIFAVLSEEKPNQKEQVRFQAEEIRKYFPKNYSSKDIQETIIKLLEKWQRQRERHAREER